MYEVFPVATVRAAEEAEIARLGGDALMQRAASGLAAVLVEELRARRGRLRGARVLLAVGTGNNGGDALWAAVRLLRRGVRAWAWRTGSTVHPAGWEAFRAAGGQEVDAVGAAGMLADVDLVVDGVLGIGGKGGLRGLVATFADACRDTRVGVVAVDLPSGLEADRGIVGEAFTADVTVTFAGHKACHVLAPARARCGALHVVDIGLGLADGDFTAWERADLAAHWPFPDASSDKYRRGVVGVHAGSATYPGAAVLAATGAVYAGAGMVRSLGEAAGAVVAALPNVVTAPGQVQAHVVGSGWGARADGPRRLAAVLADGLPAVVDADAIGMLPGGRVGSHVLLTPHAGELARLLGVERGVVEADPVGAARRASGATGAVVLLKGASQCVAEPSGRATLAVPGPAWTAQAGSGDVLAGMCGALLAAGLAPREAALAAASAQALAAARHPGPRPPQDLARLLPGLVAALAGADS